MKIKKNYIHIMNEIVKNLPEIKMKKLYGEADFYGASSLVAKGLRIPWIPISIVGWKHGWLYSELKYKEQLIAKNNYNNYLVSLKEHEYFLSKHNIASRAVGMPYIYVQDIDTIKIKRYKNSLLVMPPHSLPYTEHDFHEDEYAKEINALKKNFDLIVLCLHQSCLKKGLWIKSFAKYDIPYILGADTYDRNSLLRMHRIFQSFEYMTTNTFGSHIVYAAYSGCKVSVYGKFFEYGEQDYKDDPFYADYPEVLKHNIACLAFENLHKKYNFLFKNPIDAKQNIVWAKKELGEENKVSFFTLAKFMGWFSIYEKPKFLCRIVRNKIYTYIRKNIRVQTNR